MTARVGPGISWSLRCERCGGFKLNVAVLTCPTLVDLVNHAHGKGWQVYALGEEDPHVICPQCGGGLNPEQTKARVTS